MASSSSAAKSAIPAAVGRSKGPAATVAVAATVAAATGTLLEMEKKRKKDEEEEETKAKAAKRQTEEEAKKKNHAWFWRRARSTWMIKYYLSCLCGEPPLPFQVHAARMADRQGREWT